MCHDVALRGSEVSSIERTGRAPAAIGGVVADGIYALTAIHVYGSDRPLALRAQTTVQKTGNMVSSISIENGKTERTNASLSFAGVNVTSTPTCRFPDPGGTAQGRTAEYSVEGAEYRVYATAGRATIEQIFTRM
jgi:Tfp pilus assembly protein PilW